MQAEQRGRPPLPLPRRNKLRPFRHARRGDSTAGASCTRPHPPYPPFANGTRPRRLMALALATNRHMRARQPGARLRPVPLCCAPHARARRRARLLCTRMWHTARCLLSILTRWPAALNPDAPSARARALADPACFFVNASLLWYTRQHPPPRRARPAAVTSSRTERSRERSQGVGWWRLAPRGRPSRGEARAADTRALGGAEQRVGCGAIGRHHAVWLSSGRCCYSTQSSTSPCASSVVSGGGGGSQGEAGTRCRQPATA